MPAIQDCVRDVWILKGNVVLIEYNYFGELDGGYQFFGRYSAFEELLAALERFLGVPMSEWANINRDDEYPERLESWARDGCTSLSEAVNCGGLTPGGAVYVLRTSDVG
jgi:hypothetical protein